MPPPGIPPRLGGPRIGPPPGMPRFTRAARVADWHTARGGVVAAGVSRRNTGGPGFTILQRDRIEGDIGMREQIPQVALQIRGCGMREHLGLGVVRIDHVDRHAGIERRRHRPLVAIHQLIEHGRRRGELLPRKLLDVRAGIDLGHIGPLDAEIQIPRIIAVGIVVERFGQLLLEFLDLLLERHDGHQRDRGHVAGHRRFSRLHRKAKGQSLVVEAVGDSRAVATAIAAPLAARHARHAARAAARTGPAGHFTAFFASLGGLSLFAATDGRPPAYRPCSLRPLPGRLFSSC